MKRTATTVRALLVLGLILFPLLAHAQAVTRGPYLQQLTDSRVIVRWRTDTATDSVVRFGGNAANLDQAVEPAALRAGFSRRPPVVGVR